MGKAYGGLSLTWMNRVSIQCSQDIWEQRALRPECRMSWSGPRVYSASQAGPLDVCSQKALSDPSSMCSTSKNSWYRASRR